MDDVTDGRNVGDVVEIERWLAQQDPDRSFDVNETAAIIQELFDNLRALGRVPLDTLYVAADTERLGRYVRALRVLTNLAEHLADQDG
jgi:hypothetical protein